MCMKNLEESRPSRTSHQDPWSGRIEETSGDANWRILQKWIEGESRYDTRAHFTDTTVARNNELHECFKRLSRFSIDLQCKSISHSQPAGSLWSMLSRVKSLRFETWNLSGTQGNVFGSPRAVIDSLQTLYQWILHFESKRWKPRTCCERWRTNWKHDTIAEFGKKSINHEFFLSSTVTTEFYGWSAKTAKLGASFG